jgi:putative transposase
MPGTARKHQLQGSLIYHIINRGNRRDDVFHYPEDYKYFINRLSNYSDKFEALIYHWVIMPNHYHILLEIKDPENLSKMMAGLARSYVHYYQKNYKQGGHIWQGRFKSQPIEKESYLLRCGRYIERNPVEAKMTVLAKDYQYSSAKFYVHGISDGLTTEDPCFESFGNDISERRKNYAEFLKIFDEEGKALFTNYKSPLGGAQFKAKLIYSESRFMPRRKGKAREYAVLSM